MTTSDPANLFPYRDEIDQQVAIGRSLIILDIAGELPFGRPGGPPADLSAYDDVYIYAEAITIEAPLTAGSLLIACETIEGSAGAGLVTDGAAGASGGPIETGAVAQPGGDGQDAGNVVLICGSVSGGSLGFPISATGGAGGAGQSNSADEQGPNDATAPGGNGGNGGNGASVQVFARHPGGAMQDAIIAVAAATTPQAAASAISALAVLARADTSPLSTIVTSAISDLDAASASWSAASPQALQSRCSTLAAAVQASILDWTTSTTAAIDVSGGAYGVFGLGNPAGRDGVAGENGTRNVSTFATYDTIGQQNLLFAHPEQCSMLLQRAELAYFAGNPMSAPQTIRDVAVLLQRLLDRTSPFVSLTPTDALYQLYDSETTATTLGSGACIDTFTTVHATAALLQQQLRMGSDFFGHQAGYAPLGSYEFYKGQLSDMLEWFGTLEEQYNQYFANLAAQKSSSDQLQQALTSAEQVNAGAQDAIQSLIADAQKTLALVESYDASLPELLTSLKQAMATFETDLANAFQFDLGQLLSALGVAAYAPESALMWASDAASEIYKLDTNVIDDTDTPNVKQYLITQVQTVDGTVASLQEGYASLLSNGTLSEDDPGGALLLAQQSTLNGTLASVSAAFPADTAAVKTAFQNYVNAVLARNAQLLQYNAVILTLAKNQHVLAGTTAQLEAIHAQVAAAYDPGLPIMTVFVSRLYHQARMQVLATLYETGKAYQFWALSDTDLIASTFGNDEPPGINAAALAAAQIHILGIYESAVEAFGHGAQSFPADPLGTGVVFALNSMQIAVLASQYQLLLDVPPALIDTTSEESPFAGFANVRLTKVRLWLPGAKVSGNSLHITLTHSGSEQIVDSTGVVRSFVHDPITLAFVYDTSTNTISQDGDIATMPVGGSQTYALFGPFTYWQIGVDPALNSGVDLSGVTRAWLEFHITDYAFEPAASG
jgi:hypothetical protein